MKKAYELPDSQLTNQAYTTEEALALLIDMKLTRLQYVVLQKDDRELEANIFPPYYRIMNEMI